MTRYLVDNSVLQRLPRSRAVQDAVAAFLDADEELCCCALSVDEFAFSTRSALDHAEATRRLRMSFLFLPSSPEADLAAAEYDSDYDHIARAYPALTSRWVVPRGSVD